MGRVCWQCGVTMNSHKEVELLLQRKGVNGSGPKLTEPACFPERFLNVVGFSRKIIRLCVFRHIITKKKNIHIHLERGSLVAALPLHLSQRGRLLCACGFVKHDGVYEPCQRLQPLCSQVSRPLTPGRGAAIVQGRTSSGYPALTQKAGKAGLCYQSLGDGAQWHKSAFVKVQI